MNKVVALAYFHRYGWIVVMMGCVVLWPGQKLTCVGLYMIAYAIWSFIGYRRRWKHIYCSYQNAYHQKMTPGDVRWQTIRKSDAYGVPLICLVVGVLALVAPLLA